MELDEWPFGYGRCHCGCGSTTGPAAKTEKSRGWVKGQPRKWVNAGHKLREPWRTRFEDRGYVSHCEIWLGALSGPGYGQYNADGRRRIAHRVAWERVHSMPSKGIDLDHLCRQPACVRVDHLEAVTHAENVRRGLQTKLTKAQVLEIRASTEPQTVLAGRYGIGKSQVGRIRRREQWATDMA